MVTCHKKNLNRTRIKTAIHFVSLSQSQVSDWNSNPLSNTVYRDQNSNRLPITVSSVRTAIDCLSQLPGSKQQSIVYHCHCHLNQLSIVYHSHCHQDQNSNQLSISSYQDQNSNWLSTTVMLTNIKTAINCLSLFPGSKQQFRLSITITVTRINTAIYCLYLSLSLAFFAIGCIKCKLTCIVSGCLWLNGVRWGCYN